MANGGSASGLGSGGMTSKLQAAEIAERAGIALAIANGTHERRSRARSRQGIGTLFLPRRRAGARKAWLGGRLRLQRRAGGRRRRGGRCGEGSSLLAAGVTAVEGLFERGDADRHPRRRGQPFAHGLAEYDAAECAR